MGDKTRLLAPREIASGLDNSLPALQPAALPLALAWRLWGRFGKLR